MVSKPSKPLPSLTFEVPPDRLIRDVRNKLEFDDQVGQEQHRPTMSPLG